MPPKADTEHVPYLALEPVGSGPQRGEGIHLGAGLGFLNGNHQPQSMLVGHGVEVVDDREARRVRRSRPGVLIRNLRRGAHRHSGGGEESRRRPLPKGGVVHGSRVHEVIHLQCRILLEEPRHLEQELPAQNHGGVAPVSVGRRHCVRETVRDRLDQGSGIHGSKISGRGSGAGRLPVVCLPWILSWSFIRPSRTISGRGGHPGM